MVLSRGLVISLSVSALGCTLLFLYFRNKMSVVERKVDVMFDLIQNHQQQVSQVNYKYEQPEQQEKETKDTWINEPQPTEETNLIDISDEESDEDDSEEVSDSEDEEETPKLSLEGVDMSLKLSDVKKITVKESDKIIIDNNIELEEVEDSLDEIDDDEEEEEEDDIKEIKQITVVKEDEDNENDEFDYTKLKVSELKKIAEQKGLSNYKSLKKTTVIDLLKANE